jgi:hypothetical protein
MISQDDRLAFSLKIVTADTEVKALDQAKVQLQAEIDKVQKLDVANKNLFDPVNTLVNTYQSERALLSGITRTTFNEQSIQDAAYKKPKNAFFPNDIATSVPSLAGTQNIWTQVAPFALNTALGKTYSEAYPGTTQKEGDLIQAVQTLISSASAFSDIQATSGQQVQTVGGSCSNPIYLDQASCTLNGGSWTPGIDTIVSYPAVIQLATDLTVAVNALKAFIIAELATIATDPNSTNEAMNLAAKNDINNVILPALNLWLGYLDYNNVPLSVTAAQFPSYNPALLAPTKLHSAQLTALSSALTARLSSISTRITNLDTILGTISQNVTNGTVTGSGLYFKRYGLVSLRLNALGGSLIQLVGLSTAGGAQESIKQNTINNKATYLTVLPTSGFKAHANGTAMISVLDPGQFQVGDTVWIYAEKQEELVRAIKSIEGDRITLNDVVPAKYRISDKARIYKEA